MATINTSALFMDETAGKHGYASLSEVNKCLEGQQIVSVEVASLSSLVFRLASGVVMTLTPCGTEGDDIDLTIETTE